MAKLPQGASLIKAPRRGGTRPLRVPRQNFDSQISGINRMFRGIDEVADGLGRLAADLDEVDDFDTRRKLADFRLDTQRELEEYRKKMPAGGGGFSSGWKKFYNEKAKRFVEGLPEGQKDKVQSGLVSNYEVTSRSAQSYERSEADKYHIDSLNSSLQKQIAAVDIAPGSIDQARVSGMSLIKSSNLSPDAKRELARTYNRRLELSAVQTRLGNAKNLQDLNQLSTELEGKRTKLSPVKIFEDGKRVPTAAERRKIFKNGGVVVNADTNWSKSGATSPMVVIPNNATPEQRKQAVAYANRVADLYEKQFGKRLKPRVVTRSENGRGREATIHTEPFAVTDGKAVAYFKSQEGQQALAEITSETLGKIPGAVFSIPHNPAKGDKGAHGSGTNEVELARGLFGALRNTEGEVYAGPYQALSPDDRANLRDQVNRERVRRYRKIEKDIEQVTVKLSETGQKLSNENMTALQRRVDESGDPTLKAKLNEAVALADDVQKFMSVPIAASEAALNSLRARAQETGTTPQAEERLKVFERAHATKARLIKNDILKLANNTGLVSVQPLNLEDPASMEARMDAAKVASQKFRAPISLLTSSDVKHLGSLIESGDLPVSLIASKMVAGWGQKHAQQALAEIAPKAPAAALIGQHVAMSGGTTAVSADYETGLALKRNKAEKSFLSEAVPDDDATSEIRLRVGETLNRIPAIASMLRKAADTIYLARAHKNGWTSFQRSEYGQIIREILGERTNKDGIKFGGIGDSKDGFFGDIDPVLLPYGVRQDKFDEVRSHIKVDMLPIKPVMQDKSGAREMKDADFQDARLISVSPGKYYLAYEHKGIEKIALTADSKPFVFDFDDVRDRLMAVGGADWFLE